MRKTSVSLLMILLLCSSLPLNASAGPSDDIPTNASNTGVHNSLVAALGHADLVSTLQGSGPFTVFAPTDQAFADAGIDLADFDTDEENETLSNILLHHVLSGEVTSSMLTDGMLAEMVNGDKVKFGVGATVTVGDATVTGADVVSSNGIIHVIDKVLMPPADIPTTAGSTGIHNSLVAAVVQADLLATLEGPGPFTVFAPTDQAFTDAGISLAALDTPEGKVTLADILLYHVVSSEVPASAVTDCMSADAANSQPLSFTVGDGVMVNDANVVSADVVTSNGLIHVIDKVLTPSDTPRDIPRTAQCTGTHDSLVAAVIQAELLETLQGPGPFTVFAPTDQAFTDAGIDLASLDTPEGKAALANILLYHVVSGEVASSALTDGMTAEAVNGEDLTFDLTSGVMVNDANVITADVAASNGIIHVIDKVLGNELGDITEIAAGTGIHTSLVAALIQAELVETLQGDGPFTVFAPTDQAFADAGIDLTALDTPEGKETLADILLYHVVAANVPSSAVTDCMTAGAANGQTLGFGVAESTSIHGNHTEPFEHRTVMVNGANVTGADVAASNGVIHVIDQVLTPTDSPSNIPCVASGTGVHTSLVAALIQAELVETLQGDGPFTVFAPTDQAFTDAGIDLASLDTPEGKETLANILLYHVVVGEVPSSALTDGMTAEAVNGGELTFDLTSGVMVNDASVTAADVATSNGVIHVIDKVLIPLGDITDIAAGTGIHTSLVAALIQAELVETLQGDGPFTVFAPTDQAFADAGIDLAALDTPEGKETLANILLYHVVAANVPSSAVTDCMTADAANSQPLAFATLGNSVMVNTATVTLADVSASNGVIHVIDKVLTPSDDPNNIPRTAQCTGVHTSLVAALIQAELVETLQGDGPFTVFAPTDQAFADAGIYLDAFDTPEGKETLANILLYHVVSGEVTSSALTDGMVAEAVNGDELTFDLTSGVMVNGASVTTADVTTSNGVIHVIDKVLMPPTDEDDSSDEAKSSSDDDDSSYTIWIVIGLIVIIGGAGAVLFMRSKDSEPLMEKDLSGLLGQLEPVEATAYATQTVQQQYPTQPAQVAQPAQNTQPVQMTQAVQQPVVAEPAVLKQWTDEAGYTWRTTDDGNTCWWNGAEWQKYG